MTIVDMERGLSQMIVWQIFEVVFHLPWFQVIERDKMAEIAGRLVTVLRILL
jgi:hypothetical protein